MFHLSRAKLVCYSHWSFLICDDEIGKLYRRLYSLEYFYLPKIQKPVLGSHITITRQEKIIPENVKSEIDGMEIEYGYFSKIETDGVHFWLRVICPMLDSIRDEFNFGKSLVPYHLSIGNIKRE